LTLQLIGSRFPDQPINTTSKKPTWRKFAMSRFLTSLLSLLAIGCACWASDESTGLPAIAANDNRTPVGELRNGVLTIRLEIAKGEWRPGSDQGQAIAVHAFGEAGKSLQNPGPVIRVQQGTTIHASVHNRLPVAATVHGLSARPSGDKDIFTVQPGETREVTFKTDEPGAYYYWAATVDKKTTRDINCALTVDCALAQRKVIDTQLQGALIVDPAGAAPNDRILIISLWDDDPAATVFRGVAAINGKTWPYTERFTFKAGEAVHWRVLDVSLSGHAMHLHGSHFRIDAIGDNQRIQGFSEADRPLVFTQRVAVGQTFDMTWTPERSGRWLFHCHMVPHMTPPAPRPGVVPAAAHEHASGGEPESSGMGGLVLGITVEGTEKSAATSSVEQPAHKLQLIIDERKGGQPKFALEVRDPAASIPKKTQDAAIPAAPALIGPPIILTRGQPAEIEVQNHLKESTGIHWHGIELESYYDGVPGWSGSGKQTAPPIEPGESFVARMTPPRAGTFIYHTHWHDVVQLTNGMYGALIVLPPGQQFDANTDKIFVFGQGTLDPFGPMLLINGHPQPRPLRLSAGKKYRLRLINIAPGLPAMRASLLQAGKPVQWRMIAEDGAELAPARAVAQPAEITITTGKTYDFEYEPAGPQELALEIYLPGPKLRTTQALLFTDQRTPN
jgi:manganese oxidase